MPVTIELVDSRILISAEWRHKDMIKLIPGAKWDANLKTWWLPIAWASVKALRGVFGTELQSGPEITRWSWEYYEGIVKPALTLRNATHYAGQEDTPYAFQAVGEDMLRGAKDVLLGDEMGTGKTRQIVNAHRKMFFDGLDIFPIVVFCPNGVKSQWLQTYSEHFPEADPFVVHGGLAKRVKQFDEAKAAERPVVIINHEAARLHSRLAPYGSVALKRCPEHKGEDPKVTRSRCEVHPKELNELEAHAVVVDEAHRMKDPMAKITRAIWQVQHSSQVTSRFAATGTPIANHAGDLWSIMHGIAPYDYPTKSAYIDRYCMQSWSPFGGLDIVGIRPDTRDEFFGIFDPHFRRMPKALVLKYLPQKVRTRRSVELSPKQAKAYKDMSKGMVHRTEDGRMIIATNSLTENTRLLQFCSSYAEVNDAGDVRLIDPSTKIDELIEILGETDKPVVVCAQSRQLIELAAQRLEKNHIDYRTLVGGMTQDMRDAVKRDFMAGGVKAFLFTIQAGGTGLDGLQSQADTIIFLQRSWSLVDNLQAEDRIHRIGAEVHGESVNVIDIVAEGTVEEDQIIRLYEKAAQLEEIVRDKATLLEAYNRGDQAAAAQIATLEQQQNVLETTPLWAA